MRTSVAAAAFVAALGVVSALALRRLRISDVELVRARTEIAALREDQASAARRGLGEKRTSAGIAKRMRSLESDIARGERLHRMTLDEIEAVRRSLSRDTDALARDVLHPSVQVNGRGSVGGGTIIRCREAAPDDFETYVVTAFHVVQKAVTKGDGGETRDPIEVRVYDRTGDLTETLESDLLVYDEKKDLALLRLRSRRRYANVARLAPRGMLRDISVFTPVYAVGCPLGHDPLPSPGEISTVHKEVNGEKFWMMNAPTIFGNSGGGIFHRETHEFVGVAAMICTYDGFVSTPVPHLGILVSLLTLYDWLDGLYLQFVYDPALTPEACARMRREAAHPRSSEAKSRIEY